MLVLVSVAGQCSAVAAQRSAAGLSCCAWFDMFDGWFLGRVHAASRVEWADDVQEWKKKQRSISFENYLAMGPPGNRKGVGIRGFSFLCMYVYVRCHQHGLVYDTVQPTRYDACLLWGKKKPDVAVAILGQV